MGWGEAQGPPDCHGDRCPHYLAPEAAAHALAELTAAPGLLAALPDGLLPVLEGVVDANRLLPEPWQARVRTWHGDSIEYAVGIYSTDNDWGVIFDVWPPGPRFSGWNVRGTRVTHPTIADAVRFLRDDGRL